jgi:hypothetical protein
MAGIYPPSLVSDRTVGYTDESHADTCSDQTKTDSRGGSSILAGELATPAVAATLNHESGQAGTGNCSMVNSHIKHVLHSGSARFELAESKPLD